MNAINIIIGSLISSISFIFICISLNAEHYYKELNLYHNIEAISIKPTIILKDRSLNNPTEHKPILIKKKNCTCIEPTFYLFSDNNVSDTNLSLSNRVLKNIQNQITTLLKNRQITFKKNSSKLSKESRDILDKLLILLSEQKNFIIEIKGYTDAGGKVKVNQWISQIRANRVKKYLVQKGISSKNIVAKGFGETKLLFKDRPYSQKNRRIEIYIKRRENVRIND
ncbi:Outer membrane lipoprotein omp16 precursor [hydrothermal vent metagenome]|uniref:Outer membrane lipoprotein omp16 n=1 Tax=hydrothermal vent metagenome TaxID=652676 RepID=A0A1W1C6D6_9ZZZZ